MNLNQFAAVLGYGFALTWIVLGFSDALLCLIAAGAFAAALAAARGQLDLAELRDRLLRDDDEPAAATPRTRRVR